MNINSLTEAFTKALRGDPVLGPRMAELEVLDQRIKEALPHVDLDIAFSPVVMFGDDIDTAVEVEYLGTDGKYHVRTGPQSFEKVSPEDLKPMRARFLLLRDDAAMYRQIMKSLK